MTSLPIAQRELRVAARRKRTWILRVMALLIALVPAFFYLATFRGDRVVEYDLFRPLSWISYAGCMLGCFLTFDSISREKREGTLGLLFLAPLRPYDSVLGKLAARWIDAFYCLMAMFPVIG